MKNFAIKIMHFDEKMITSEILRKCNFEASLNPKYIRFNVTEKYYYNCTKFDEKFKYLTATEFLYKIFFL